jgi:hypothetical protein
MKNVFGSICLLMVVCVIGCSGGGNSKLQGTWAMVEDDSLFAMKFSGKNITLISDGEEMEGTYTAMDSVITVKIGDVIQEFPYSLNGSALHIDFDGETMVLINTKLAGSGRPANAPVITVKNNTGSDIYFLYISKANIDKWEEDVLDDEVLEAGETVEVTLPARGKWDLRAEDEDDDSYTIYNINVQGKKTVVISLDDLDS